MATDFRFSGNDILSFIYFFENVLAITGRPVLKKKILYLLVETVFSFSRHWFEWKQLFGTVKLYFSTNASFWVVEMDHRLITNLVLLLLSRAFFCWWTPFLKLGVNQFSSIFSVLNSGSSFSAGGNRFFIKYFIPGSGNGFFAKCSFIQSKFCAIGNHY